MSRHGYQQLLEEECATEYAYNLAEAWKALYRRAINEANNLTNFVEDCGSLRAAERKIEAIEAEARALQG